MLARNFSRDLNWQASQQEGKPTWQGTVSQLVPVMNPAERVISSCRVIGAVSHSGDILDEELQTGSRLPPSG